MSATVTTPADGKPAVRRVRGSTDVPTLVVTCLVVLLLGLLIGYPLLRILTTAVSPAGSAVMTGMVTSPVNRKILGNTVLLGSVVGLLGTLIGFLMAFLQVRVALPGKRLLHLVSLLPVVSPPFAVATAVISLFGRRGIITHGLLGWQTQLYGLPGLVLVLVLSFFPVAYMNFKGLLESLDPALDEAAADLGATAWKRFWTMTVPLLAPGFAASFLLLFVESIADLANPLVIGGDFTVLASRAYIAITGEYDVASGAAYSVVLLVPAVLVFLIQRYWVSRKSVVSVTGKPAGQPTLLSGRGTVPLIVAGYLVLGLVALIYVTVLLGGFVKILGINNELTLDNYAYVLGGIGNESIKDTTLLAALATPVAGLLGMLIAWLVVRKLRRLSGAIDLLGMLGLAVPGTVVGIGYAIAFSTPWIIGNRMYFPALAGGGGILGGALAIVMVYVIRSLPSGQQTGIAALRQIDPAIDEASASLGADSITTFRRVTLPLIRPAFLAGLIYAFARSMTTISAIIFITTPQTQIMTKQILAEVDSGRFGNAFAFSTVLLCIVLVVMGVLSLLVRGNPAARTVGGGQ